MENIVREAQGRLKIGRPVAIIDIGSNSVRLVAYEGMARALTPIYNEKVLCGLGRHVATTGRLDDQAVDRALRALARFRVLCETMQVSAVFVLAAAAWSWCSRVRRRHASPPSESSPASTRRMASWATWAAAAWSWWM
jgi:exopolyphosphatase/guanosine-5'-triphosphate,3'-diphosphate pyrophosphatase